MAKNPLPNEVYVRRQAPRKGDVRGPYFRDQTAIIHSHPFRRLKHKTQVFFSPQNDHVCTRIEHVMHVATIAATICKGLNSAGWDLDVELAYAIGLGHDLGHGPFGHVGEQALNDKLVGKRTFVHEVHSYRVVEHLAHCGKGLNLTYAVKDGIICHNGERFENKLLPAAQENDLEKIVDRRCMASSYEGCVVRFADKIAYLGRDIEDALVGKLIERRDIPADVAKGLGNTNAEIIESCVVDMIENTKDSDMVRFSDETIGLMQELKRFNYKRIYFHDKMLITGKFCHRIISNLFDHLLAIYLRCGCDFPKYEESGIRLDSNFGRYIRDMDVVYGKVKTMPETIVTDFIAGMTDLYAVESMKQISLPSPIDFG
ncbi:MAG: HD domain-containing protein [Elusimicrobiota bacterium]